jgi:hypothetical protein
MKSFVLYAVIITVGTMFRVALPEGSLADILAIASAAIAMASFIAAIRERDEGFASIGFGIAFLFAGFVIAHAITLTPAGWWLQFPAVITMTALEIALLGAGCVWIISRQHSTAVASTRR